MRTRRTDNPNRAFAAALMIVTFVLNAVALAGTALAQDLPRFMSLKVDKVELRPSPDASTPPQWIFRRAGLPVEVMGSENGWARVRDTEGATGWVQANLLSRRRTAAVLKTGQTAATEVALRSDDSDTASVVALLEPGLLLNLFECDGKWCLAGLNETRGYIAQRQLWGVAPDEAFK